ncbi:hypothetical protein CBS101457_003282 [Exobasidium rhododendri]|nr:hypothetical protein CBS101457_003282 [Exobasidium rhododendri]
MAGFQDLQALAAARSKASQEKLASERATREAADQARRLALENKAKLDLQKERQTLIAREMKRKEEAEKSKLQEIERAKASAARAKKRLENEKEIDMLDMSKFHKAKMKAIVRAGGSAKVKRPSNGKRKGREDSVSPPPHMREYSTLTREEKRKKKEAVMLGLSNSTKRRAPTSSSSQHHKTNVASVGDLIVLGKKESGVRSVDALEGDSKAPGKAKFSLDDQRTRVGEAERSEWERRRKRAMEEKRKGEESGARSYVKGNSSRSEEEADHEREKYTRGKRSSHSPVRVNARTSFGLNPADFLPGAPIRAKPSSSTTDKVASRSEAKQSGSFDKKMEINAQSKKDTPRERFLREEAERKRRQEKSTSSTRYEESDEDENDDSEDKEDYESDDSEEEEELGHNHSSVRDEIWKMFNRRDRKEYIARDIESDDDMEADMESVRREEERSARIARMEDKREEEALRRKEQEKASRRAAAAMKVAR